MTILGKLQTIWKNRNIRIPTKAWLLHVLVWSVAPYGCKAWTLKKDEAKRTQAFEMKCLQKILPGRLHIHRKRTNDKVLSTAGTERHQSESTKIEIFWIQCKTGKHHREVHNARNKEKRRDAEEDQEHPGQGTSWNGPS